MNTTQFSDEFDILLNTQSILKPFGLTQGVQLDEYEKSVFLSNAQEELVRNTYEGINIKRESFEETEIKRRYLDKLIKQKTVNTKINIVITEHIQADSIFFELPTDLMVITNEQLRVTSGTECYNNIVIDIIPVRQDEYLVNKKNPFRVPSMKGRTNQAWRLDYGNNAARVVEIIAPTEVIPEAYIVRYIRKPSPIILTTLHNLDIDGFNDEQTSELDSIFHRQILELAVIKALQAKTFTQKETQ